MWSPGRAFAVVEAELAERRDVDARERWKAAVLRWRRRSPTFTPEERARFEQVRVFVEVQEGGRGGARLCDDAGMRCASSRVSLGIVWASMSALAPSAARAGETQVVLEGEVPADGLDHFFLPFEVPAGTVEIQVSHDDLSDEDILDWGLDDPAGFRGWGGGNSEDAIVGVTAASRSYVPGPIAAGTWRVVVGKAKIVSSPAKYKVVVTLRDAPTLAPQTERQPYAAADLGGGPRWLAGDLHVHSRESGDAAPDYDAIAEFARGRGLDFVVVSEHNTTSHVDLLVDAQSRHPELLLIPGIEFTTYDGHANLLGATSWVDHRLGQPGVTIEGAATAAAAQGAIFSINHPALDLGELCIGCAWKQELDPALVGAVEVATGGLDKAGKVYTPMAIAFWDGLAAKGYHLAAVGGSDDHKGGVDEGLFQSPIGDPTTMVYAETLSAAAILAGVRAGRTAVKLQGPGDPGLELGADVAAVGDTIAAESATLTAVVRGAPAGARVRFVHDGAPVSEVAVAGDPFEHAVVATAPARGMSRWRAEVLIEGRPRTITSHVWIERGQGGGSGGESSSGGDGSSSDASSGGSSGAASTGGGGTATGGQEGDAGASGCGCRSGEGGGAAALAAWLWIARWRRRRGGLAARR